MNSRPGPKGAGDLLETSARTRLESAEFLPRANGGKRMTLPRKGDCLRRGYSSKLGETMRLKPARALV